MGKKEGKVHRLLEPSPAADAAAPNPFARCVLLRAWALPA